MAIFFAVNCLLLGILSKGVGTPHSVVQESNIEETNPLDFIPSAQTGGNAETAAPGQSGTDTPPAPADNGTNAK